MKVLKDGILGDGPWEEFGYLRSDGTVVRCDTEPQAKRLAPLFGVAVVHRIITATKWSAEDET